MSYKELLDKVCEINGYKSVTDVSVDHPTQHMGRPVVWVEMVAAPSAFVVVNDRDTDDVSRVNLDSDVQLVLPVRPRELDGSLTAHGLAVMPGFHMSTHVKMLSMGTWGV